MNESEFAERSEEYTEAMLVLFKMQERRHQRNMEEVRKQFRLSSVCRELKAKCTELQVECLEQARLLAMSAEREAGLLGKMERERILADRLATSARNVIAQWDTPNWKLTQSTAEFINALRDSVAAWEETINN